MGEPTYRLNYEPELGEEDSILVEGFLDEGLVFVEVLGDRENSSGVNGVESLEGLALGEYEEERTLEVGSYLVEQDVERLLSDINWDREEVANNFGAENVLEIEVDYEGEEYRRKEMLGENFFSPLSPDVEIAIELINRYVEQV